MVAKNDQVFSLLLALTVFCVCTRAQNSNCYYGKYCSGESIYLNSNIRCYGFSSCITASQLRSSSSNEIECSGAFSCYEASLIQSGSSSSYIYCYGLFSCAKVDSIAAYTYLYCWAEQSCAESTISFSSGTTYNMLCYGSQSCAFSDITAYGVVFYGALAAQNSTIRTLTSGTNYYVLDGSDVGHGTQFVCSGTCSITCYGTACDNVNIDGSSGTLSFTCIDATKSSACPDGFELPLPIPSLADHEFSTYSNSYESCEVTNAINCDDYSSYGSCYSSALLSTFGNPGPVCCTGYLSCRLVTNINASLGFRVDDYSVGGTAFRADGFYSTEAISGSITAVSGGHIYFTGSHANYASSIIYRTVIQGDDSGNYDLIVTGYVSMRYKVVHDMRHIYCLAYQSCYYASFYNIKGNIYSYSYQAMYYGSVSNVSGDVYCDGRSACQYLSASNITGNVVGVGPYIMQYADLIDIQGDIVAYGERAMEYGTISGIRTHGSGGTIYVQGIYSLGYGEISDVSAIVAEGTQVLYEAKITGISRLEVNGEDTLDGAVIITSISNVSENVFAAVLNGTSSDSFSIHCNRTDICTIKCVGPQSCRHLWLHCEGTCYIDCDNENGNRCPYVWGHWEFLTTMAPSDSPTPEPSLLPSDMPSISPTEDPSSLPTEMPTRSPITIIYIHVGQNDTDSETSSSSTSKSADDDVTDTVIVGISIVVVSVVCIVVIFYLRSQSKTRAEIQMKEIDLKRLQTELAMKSTSPPESPANPTLPRSVESNKEVKAELSDLELVLAEGVGNSESPKPSEAALSHAQVNSVSSLKFAAEIAMGGAGSSDDDVIPTIKPELGEVVSDPNQTTGGGAVVGETEEIANDNEDSDNEILFADMGENSPGSN